jgi:hypothetical protein
MRKSTLAALTVVGLAATLASYPTGALAGTSGPDRAPDQVLDLTGEPYATDLIAAKAATAPYRDVAEAEADGYVLSSPMCVPSKGVHYLRSVAESPEELVITEPNALVYAPTSNGGLKLLGVEYVSRVPATLFGRDFEQSGAVHYYTLHVWLWEKEPVELIAADNPHITCEI